MALCDRLEAAQKKRESRQARLATATLQSLQSETDADTLRKNARFFIKNLPRLTARPEQVEELRQTILNLAVRGQLVAQDTTDEPASQLFIQIRAQRSQLLAEGSIPQSRSMGRGQATLTFTLPKKWESVRLGDVCNLVTSGSRGWAEFYSKLGPTFIRAQNIRFGKLLLQDLAHVNPPNKAEGSRTQVSRGDLLIVITGAGVTNPAMLDKELGEAYVSQHVGLIRPATTDLSRWLLLCLMAPAGGRAELVERAYGAGKPGLNLDNIRSLSIPLPPLAEQLRILGKVDQLMTLCNCLEEKVIAKQKESRNLLKVVLHEALDPVAIEAL